MTKVNEALNTEKKNGRNHKVIHSTKHIQDVMDMFGKTQQQLGDILGVSGSAIGHWMSTGKCPKWTLLAVEGIMRRQKSKDTETIFVCIPTNRDARISLESFTKAVGISIHKINLPISISKE